MSGGFLLATNVLSATPPDRRIVPEPAKAAARRWILANQSQIYLPVTAIIEIAAGIGAWEGAGATRHAMELADWLKAVLGAYPEKILALDTEAALHARSLALVARQAGAVAGCADLMVACIARARGLVVATRNVRDFAPMGIAVVDPFSLVG